MPTTSLDAAVAKLRAIPEFLETERGLIGRRTEVHVTTAAIIAKLHVLLYGTAGVAKSMTVDGILGFLPELSQFKTQAYKASPPEQFLGQISLKGMADDEFYRLIAGKLADCDVAFIDELSRAPRAVLPAFQGMMVEREFDSGRGVERVPLMSLIGAVNHLLEDDSELAAFFDRFTLKLVVTAPPSQGQFVDILKGALSRRSNGDAPIPDEMLVTRDELELVQHAVTQVSVPDDVVDAAGELWANLTGIGITPSIRRYVDLTKAMQAAAVLDGRDTVIVDDLQMAQHSLWTAADERAAVHAQVVSFASEWVKDSASIMDDFNDTLDRLGQVQALVASGSTGTTKTEIGEKERSLTDHGIAIVHEQRVLRAKVAKHIAAAEGRDTAQLDAVVTQIDAAKSWIQDRLLAGLSL